MFFAAFNTISVIPRLQLTLFMSFFGFTLSRDRKFSGMSTFRGFKDENKTKRKKIDRLIDVLCRFQQYFSRDNYHDDNLHNMRLSFHRSALPKPQRIRCGSNL